MLNPAVSEQSEAQACASQAEALVFGPTSRVLCLY